MILSLISLAALMLGGVLVVLTKADKLNKTEQAKALSIMRLQAGGGEVQLFSAPKRQGIDAIAQILWSWAHPVEPEALPAA